MGTYFVIMFAASLLFLATMFFDFDHGDVSVDHHGDGWLSLRSVVLFALGFGAGGVLAMKLFALTAFAASPWGVVVGLGSTLVGLKVAGLFLDQESDSTSSVGRLVGRTGFVSLTISPIAMGQIVVLDDFGHTAYLTARASELIDMGTPVVIAEAVGSEVIVRPALPPAGITLFPPTS